MEQVKRFNQRFRDLDAKFTSTLIRVGYMLSIAANENSQAFGVLVRKKEKSY